MSGQIASFLNKFIANRLCDNTFVLNTFVLLLKNESINTFVLVPPGIAGRQEGTTLTWFYAGASGT
jgi:hypothetical protein